MKKILLLLISIMLLGCEGEEDRMANCSGIICVSEQVRLSFRNAAGNPLIGTTFVQDSFKLSSSNQVLYLKPQPTDNEENLAINYTDLASGVDYTLELSATESDMLNFTFSSVYADCCTDFFMQQLRFNNNVVATESEDFYVLIK